MKSNQPSQSQTKKAPTTKVEPPKKQGKPKETSKPKAGHKEMQNKKESSKKETKEAPKEVFKEAPKEAPKKTLKEEPKIKDIVFKDLAKLMKEKVGKKWYAFIDNTGGNLFTFLKYQGSLIMTYTPEDVTPEKIKQAIHAVLIGGYNTTWDFKGDLMTIDIMLEKKLIPKEIANPISFRTEEMVELFKVPTDDHPYFKDTGMFIFLFSEEKCVPKWIYENTDVMRVNP